MKKHFIAALLLAVCGGVAQAQTQQELNRDGNGGNTDNVLTYGMGYHQQRFSKLDQINKNTIKRLVPVWSASTGADTGEQGQPLVHNGVLYTANVKQVIAVDVSTGRQLWNYALEWDPGVPRIVCCGLNNKGVAIFDGKVYTASLDAHIHAIDAKTGKGLWKSKIAEWKDGYSITSAPSVANGIVMSGMTGGEFGVCVFTDNYQCEEWALFRGECPKNGLRVTGYVTPAGRYCAITGGRYSVVSAPGATPERGTCSFPNGSSCPAEAYFAGTCGR